MYELRVSSGQHRCATLPLDDRPHQIGSGDSSDLVLIDPDIAAHHATLWRTKSGWLLAAADGEIYPADSDKSQNVIELMPGSFAHLGDVWLTVVEQDAPWEEPPQQAVNTQPDAVAIDSASDASPADEEDHAARRRRHRQRIILVPFAVLATVTAAAAYAMLSKPVTELDARNSPMQASMEARPVFTQEQLRQEFRQRLTDAGLMKRFNLQLDDATWLMQASLDDEESKQFERVLVEFMRERQVTFPVRARIEGAASMLPFKIHMVTSGSNASVVMQDGRRVFVGEEYLGVRVVAIEKHRITFAGQRRIVMNW